MGGGVHVFYYLAPDSLIATIVWTLRAVDLALESTNGFPLAEMGSTAAESRNRATDPLEELSTSLRDSYVFLSRVRQLVHGFH